MQIIPIDEMIRICKNEKRGTLREAFDGEQADFVQEHDKECTGIMMKRKSDPVGLSVTFTPPLFLEAGVGYVFEESE